MGHLAAIQASQQSGQHRGLALNIDLADPIFHDEARAVAFVEATRWPEGVTCPHCASDRVRRMGGKTQAGMFLCNACRRKFTCRTRTVMERSHVPLRKWLLAAHLLAASGKGLSAREMERTLGVTYKTAWFLRHRNFRSTNTPRSCFIAGRGRRRDRSRATSTLPGAALLAMLSRRYACSMKSILANPSI